jgi:hypothetical protein
LWKIYFIRGVLNVAISDSSVRRWQMNQKPMESGSHGVILSEIPMCALSD